MDQSTLRISKGKKKKKESPRSRLRRHYCQTDLTKDPIERFITQLPDGPLAATEGSCPAQEWSSQSCHDGQMCTLTCTLGMIR